MIAKTLLATVAIVLLASANAEYDVAKYCQLVKTGSKLPSMTSCQNYYLCGPNNQPLANKCDDNMVFNKDAQDCVPQGQGNCYFGLANPCENKDKEFAPSAEACNQWHYCVNGGIAGTGSCQAGQIFSASSGSCIYGKCNSDNSNNGYTAVQNVCDIMQNGQFFGDFKNCNAWHRCSDGKEKVGKCGDNLVYDAKTGMCLKNDGTMCDRTGGASTSNNAPPASTCSSDAAVKLVGDKNICSVYYECKQVQDDTTPTSYQWVEMKCSYNQYYDVIDQKCESRSSARPYQGCNRCEFTTGSPYWVNNFSTNCTSYSTCRNGQKLTNGNSNCISGNYFDEDQQYCTTTTMNYDNYVENHGACQAYSCADDGSCKVTTVPTPE